MKQPQTAPLIEAANDFCDRLEDLHQLTEEAHSRSACIVLTWDDEAQRARRYIAGCSASIEQMIFDTMVTDLRREQRHRLTLSLAQKMRDELKADEAAAATAAETQIPS